MIIKSLANVILALAIHSSSAGSTELACLDLEIQDIQSNSVEIAPPNGTSSLTKIRLPFGLEPPILVNLLTEMTTSNSWFEKIEVLTIYGSRTHNLGYGYPPKKQSDLDIKAFWPDHLARTGKDAYDARMAKLRPFLVKLSKQAGYTIYQDAPVVAEFFKEFFSESSIFSKVSQFEERNIWDNIYQSGINDGLSYPTVKRQFRDRKWAAKGALIILRRSMNDYSRAIKLLRERDYQNILTID